MEATEPTEELERQRGADVAERGLSFSRLTAVGRAFGELMWQGCQCLAGLSTVIEWMKTKHTVQNILFHFTIMYRHTVLYRWNTFISGTSPSSY